MQWLFSLHVPYFHKNLDDKFLFLALEVSIIGIS